MTPRFHEISLPTTDIQASMDFYQSLGFTPLDTGDTLSHRYGVVTDGRLVLGLHESPERVAGLTFIRPELSAWADELLAAGLTPSLIRTHPEAFNEIAVDGPAGNRLWLIEAPIHAAATAAQQTSHCGEFLHLGLPARHPEDMCLFWERFGFVAMGESDDPYAHHALTSDHLNLALHSPRLLDTLVLVFSDPDPERRIARLRDTGLTPQGRVPRGLPQGSAIFEAPEGTQLLILGPACQDPDA